MLNTKNAAAVAAAEAQLQQQLAHAAHLRGATSNMSSDHSSNSQHGDPHLYAPNGSQPLHPINNLSSDMKYSPPSQIPHIQLMQNGYLPIKQEHSYQSNDTSSTRSTGDGLPKAFPCSFDDCSKSFARRSDLARHREFLPMCC